MKGLYDLKTKILRAGKNAAALVNFLTGVIIIPVFQSLDTYAKEKARLRKIGQPVDDFDLLIGATAISNGLILVTNNVDHLGRMEGLVIEDWTK